MKGSIQQLTKLAIAFIGGFLFHIGYLQIFNQAEQPENTVAKALYQEELSASHQQFEDNIYESELIEDITISENDPQSLREELKRLRKEIASFKNSQKEKEAQKARQREIQREMMKHLMSKEFRKQNALDNITNINNELKGVLGLSDSQAELLEELLVAKVENEVDSMMELNSVVKELTREESIARRKDMRVSMEEERRAFEEKISAELTTEQIENYLDYEKKKVKQQHKKSLLYRKAKIQSLISDLDEYQTDEINRFFEEFEPNLDNVKIGNYGSQYYSFLNMQSRTQENTNIEYYLSTILSPEQFEKYKKKSH